MRKDEFLATFVQLLQCESTPSLTDRLKDIDEWDSMAMMVIIAYFDTKLKTPVTFAQLEKAKTVRDIASMVPNLEEE